MDNQSFSYTGWLPNGNRVTFNFSITDVESAVAYAVSITNSLATQGFRTSEIGLEDGEEREVIVTVMRREKPSDGTPIVDFYTEWGAGNAEPFGTYKYQHLYMDKDKPEMLADFLHFSGFKSLEDIPLYDGQNPLKRTFGRKHPKETTVPTPFRIVKKQGAEKTATDGKKYRPWDFVRYEAINATPQPQPAAASAPVAGSVEIPTHGDPEVKPEPPRNARLQNEEIVITRAVFVGKVTGNKDPRKNGNRYDCWGKIEDGGQMFDVRISVFPEDVIEIEEHGYAFQAGEPLAIPVITDTTDRAMTRIGKVVPKAPENAAKELVSTFVVNTLKSGKPYLVFPYGDTYAYSYTREPFRVAGYDVTGWDTVGNHEMPTPAEIVVAWDKQQKQLIVKSAVMVDVFDKVSGL